ncbi:Alpha-L-fucosidase [Stieleria maiorica]|uniref:alpha-L-fucosidase n=1 Tax=Stieleria maiorica TaxID=2795974 RepID=A0A5B9MDE8_9BACT|nr:alpha-L-fucosidase [Stieleria maiorica]QEF97980.1 Alpha-L-fucosidase [Stieleria maiorica]
MPPQPTDHPRAVTDQSTRRLPRVLIMLMLLCSGFACQDHAFAQQYAETQDDQNTCIAWWRDAKFGMFVHWGVYSVVGGQYKGQELPNSAEWMMARGKIPISEYEQYAKQFNPVDFDADEFVGLAKQAGMKYLVITAKHHDGFAMFDSKATEYNVVDFSPFGRDIMKELAEACQRQGIKFGFYYSQAQDWHHPGGFGNSWDKSIQRISSDQYVREKAVPEVRQLLTEYGPIGIFWWDTPRAMSEQAFNSLHSLTKLQPDVLTNDRLGENFPGDYKTFERNIPRQAPAAKDWEVCMPISGSWGYKKSDTKFKSTRTLIQNLADIASKGGNYLLNVSPTGKGTLLPQATDRLRQIGQWMQTNGESIYGTTASPIGKPDWGRCTAKVSPDGTALYLHVFDWPSDQILEVRGLANQVLSATLLGEGQSVTTEVTDDGIRVRLPEQPTDEFNSVIKLVVDGAPKVKSLLPTPGKDGVLELGAELAFIHNNEGSRDAGIRQHDGIDHIGYWHDDQAWVEWEIEIRDPGDYRVSSVLSVQEPQTRFRVSVHQSELTATVTSTGGYGRYAEKDLGTLRIDQPGRMSVRVHPIPGSWQPINLRQLTLKRDDPAGEIE